MKIKIVSKNPIVWKIANGEASLDIINLLLQRQLPFTEEEYLESFVFLLKDERFKLSSIEKLKKISEPPKLNYVEKSTCNHRVVYFVLLEALSSKNSKIISKIIRNQSLPSEFLVKIAEKGSLSMLEMLLDNQIKLIAYPEIMEAMEKNSESNNFIHGKINEIREFYLREEKAEEIKAEDVLDQVKNVIAQEQHDKQKLDELPSETEKLEEMEEVDMLEIQVEEKALTTLQEINSMTISERIKLALSGSRSHRMILIKDPNKMVSLSVIESPKVTTDEIILITKNKSIDTEIIGRISRNREWTKNYSIVCELVQNPKTPVKSALGFIKQLHLRDLKMATRNKNVSPVIRELAINFYNQKMKTSK